LINPLSPSLWPVELQPIAAAGLLFGDMTMTGFQLISGLRTKLLDGKFISRWSIDDPALGALDAPEKIEAGAMFQYMPAGDGRRKAIGMPVTVLRDALQ
jgi:hypothetical protein